jgi:hypothetical protein
MVLVPKCEKNLPPADLCGEILVGIDRVEWTSLLGKVTGQKKPHAHKTSVGHPKNQTVEPRPPASAGAAERAFHDANQSA